MNHPHSLGLIKPHPNTLGLLKPLGWAIPTTLNSSSPILTTSEHATTAHLPQMATPLLRPSRWIAQKPYDPEIMQLITGTNSNDNWGAALPQSVQVTTLLWG